MQQRTIEKSLGCESTSIAKIKATCKQPRTRWNLREFTYVQNSCKFSHAKVLSSFRVRWKIHDGTVFQRLGFSSFFSSSPFVYYWENVWQFDCCRLSCIKLDFTISASNGVLSRNSIKMTLIEDVLLLNEPLREMHRSVIRGADISRCWLKKPLELFCFLFRYKQQT